MDVVKPKDSKSTVKAYSFYLLVAVVFTGVFIWYLTSENKEFVNRDELLIASVSQGDLTLSVSGFGVMQSAEQKLVTAFVNATVDSIELKPGAAVSPGVVIMTLSNPQLLQDVEVAKNQLTVAQGEFRRVVLTNKRKKLDEEAELARLQSELEGELLRLKAEESLVEKGIVSKLSYQSSLLKVQQLERDINTQKNRLIQLVEFNAEEEDMQLSQVKQRQSYLSFVQEQLDRLVIKADMEGVLLRSPVSLGQSVSAGQELALIGSTKSLNAQIRISQNEIDNVQLEQSAQVRIKNEIISGFVRRISPEVQDGSVLVEIGFDDALSSAARPEMMVEASITTSTIKEALYIRRPPGVQPNRTAKIFKLNPDTDNAVSTSIRFGKESGKYILILDGVAMNDQLIISDMKSYKNKNTLYLR
ncbi:MULTISPECIES: HlyD family efflux transporter periplasmic adaptor subunit [unclassified Pseudoalteromonas]|uniref:HlyD family secretion protein n=1 Tax=unclassified Pseudoalteromonas TaxID=194690 RepID=UPI002097589D|nr:HlyD family efflux transporter periplasmic adaptor subunit [Pseudoalteromonas sp. XMcav2-N]MCO7191012.1 efflux RND transporter periplasmic adaptor subunit [Pseudoalteromonas sp. XMcav2-N]